jgi:hypothetical protein
MNKPQLGWSLLATCTLGALGCSSPVPPSPQASATISVSGGMCPSNGKHYSLGNPAPTTSEVDPGSTLINGSKGATVGCTVSGGGTFSFSGSLDAISTEGSTVRIDFTNGVINPPDSNGTITGTAASDLYTSDLLEVVSTGATPCTLSVINQQVKPGAIWASFTCSSETAPPSDSCNSSGVIVFQDCAQ